MNIHACESVRINMAMHCFVINFVPVDRGCAAPAEICTGMLVHGVAYVNLEINVQSIAITIVVHL